MTSILEIVRQTARDFAETQLASPFDRCGLDSFDLLEIRVRLESEVQRAIPDGQWFSFKSFQDIQRYLDDAHSGTFAESTSSAVASQRAIALNMPQMALGGLSESWLLKELGDMHWSMTCDALQSESGKLTDELGNRLYATFVRVRLESSAHLKKFRENERLEFEARLTRFGRSMFFSDLKVQGEKQQIDVSLMTTFSLRQTDNKSLLKGEPLMPAGCKARVLDSLPRFAEEYREMRKGDKQELVLANEKFALSKDLIFETTYAMNPYLDLNGVNLLYFAAYPMISDLCELEFIEHERPDLSVNRWPFVASTLARDVYYYGNCDLEDHIVFGVNSFSLDADGRCRIATSLFRESDRQLIANIFTVKQVHE
ncbi:MAG TPA: Pnap_2097 family protein [Pyrinomonadaceae bacterium]